MWRWVDGVDDDDDVVVVVVVVLMSLLPWTI